MGFGYWDVLNFLWSVGAVIGLILALRFDILPRDRVQAFRFGLIWIPLATLEFWVAGPWSFIFTSNELNFNLPIYLYYNNWHEGGLYAHAFAGGADAVSMAYLGGQYVSLERFLLDVFPLWIANGVHKILVVSTGYWATYALIRRVAGLSRETATALAAFYTLSFPFIISITWASGLGYAIFPLATYLIVFRVGRRWYYPGVIAVSALIAASSAPTHSGLVLVFLVCMASLMRGMGTLVRIVPGMFILVGFIVLNWHEVFYGMALLGPNTLRGSVGVPTQPPIVDDIIAVAALIGKGWFLLLPILVLSPLVRVKYWAHTLFVLIGTIAIPIILVRIPWVDVGMAPFGAINFHYMTDAIHLLIVLAFVLVFVKIIPSIYRFARARFLNRDINYQRVVQAILLGLAFGQFAWHKGYHSAEWVSKGGLMELSTAAERVGRNWAAGAEPSTFRVISTDYRFAANYAPAIGLHSLDGIINLNLRNVMSYWFDGIIQPDFRPEKVVGNYSGFWGMLIDSRCCDSYDITRYLNVDLLRAANVGFILSSVPLRGGGIEQVSGPTANLNILRRTSRTEDIATLVKLIRTPIQMRVYALPLPLPRVYAAVQLLYVNKEVSESEYLRRVSRLALERRLVTRGRHVDPAWEAHPSLRVNSYRLEDRGVEVSVDSPDGGILAVNIPHNRFWKAYADGRPIEDPLPANGIQMAVRVPPAVEIIDLVYERPMLRDKALQAFSNP